MSLTDRLVEMQNDHDQLKDVLDALLDCDLLGSDVAEGIAKKIIAGGSVEDLSERQKFVFDTYIAKHFKMVCGNSECEHEISWSDLAEAIRSDAAGEGAECEFCLYYRHQMEKDD